MREVTVAATQLACSWDTEANVERAVGLVRECAERGAPRARSGFPLPFLEQDRPGRSYGLSIARRLGFPGTVLDRAETHLSEGDARLDDLLERLQRTEREGRALSESLTAEKEQEVLEV